MGFLRILIAGICIFPQSSYCVLFASENLPKKKVHIGIITDGDAVGLERTRQTFCQETRDLLKEEFEVSFTDESEFKGNWTIEGIRKAVDEAYTNSGIDIVVGIGAMSSNEISKRENLPKPSFAPFVLNIELQQLPLSKGTSGVDNFNYLTFPTNLERDFTVFSEIVPFEKLTVMINGFVLDAIPGLANAIESFAEVDIDIFPVMATANEALERLPPNVEAVYVLPLSQMPDEELKRLANGLNKRKIPSFSLFSQRYLENGFFVSMSPDTDLPRLIRRLALNIQKVLLGENPKNLSVYVSESHQLTLNMKTARAIGVSLPWQLLQEAVLINVEDDTPGLSLSLIDAVHIGLEGNFTLAAAKKELDVGREEVSKAYSYLLPQISVSGNYIRIDKDRARGSFGVHPEKGIWGNAALSQVLYSNELIGGIHTERHLQLARQHGYYSYRLHTVLAITQAYLNLLRSQTIERVHRNNLEKTRSHLKLARQRVHVGTARSSEVYRWESQYANDMTTVTVVSYQTKSNETALKYLLNIPQDQKIFTMEVKLEESFWQQKREWLVDHVNSDTSLELFIDYSIQEALSHSEDIRKLQLEICAQADVLGMATRALWTPDVFLEAMVSDRAKEWGTGSSNDEMKALYNSTDWAVSFNVSFPLYTGGHKSAVKRQACEELKRLNLELKALFEAVKEKVRRCAYNAAGSYTVIGLSQKAADNAQDNLSLVQDSYSKGVVSIVDLLDAQNQELVADLETGSAVYDFLIDLVEFQRYVGRFDFFSSEEEIKVWVDDIDYYFKVHLKEG